MKHYASRITLMIFSALMSMGTAHAGKLSDAFKDMTSNNSAGFYESQVRSGFDLGSGRMSAPRRVSLEKNLVEITPPSISAGCSGINYHLGGMGFINFEEIIELLENTLMATPYVAMELAITALSEMIGNIISDALGVLMDSTSMSLDSCAMARSVTAFGMQKLDLDKARCEVTEGARPSSFGYQRAKYDACSSLEESRDKLINQTKADRCKYFSWDSETQQECSTAGGGENTASEIQPCVGNCTWAALKVMGINPMKNTTDNKAREEMLTGIVHAELLQSAFGIHFENAATADPSVNEPASKSYVEMVNKGQAKLSLPPSISSDDLFTTMLCGSIVSETIQGKSDASVAIEEIAKKMKAETGIGEDSDYAVAAASIYSTCKAFSSDEKDGKKKAASSVYVCYKPRDSRNRKEVFESGDIIMGNESANDSEFINNQKSECFYVAKVNLTDYLNFPYVQQSLDRGFIFNTFAMMVSIKETIEQGNVELSNEQIQFISSAPFPLYRLLNLATLFPSIGSSLVESVGLSISNLMTIEYINFILKSSRGRGNTNLSINSEVLNEVIRNLENMVVAQADKILLIDEAMNRSVMFTNKIRSIESALLEQVYSRGLMGSYSFSQDLYSQTIRPPTP